MNLLQQVVTTIGKARRASATDQVACHVFLLTHPSGKRKPVFCAGFPLTERLARWRKKSIEPVYLGSVRAGKDFDLKHRLPPPERPPCHAG